MKRLKRNWLLLLLIVMVVLIIGTAYSDQRRISNYQQESGTSVLTPDEQLGLNFGFTPEKSVTLPPGIGTVYAIPNHDIGTRATEPLSREQQIKLLEECFVDAKSVERRIVAIFQ